MSPENSVKSVLEFAIAREVDSYNFYMTLAERVEHIEIKKFLDELAQQELGHKEKLELELIKIGQTLPVENQPLTYSEPPMLSDIDLQIEINYKEILMVAMEKEEASFRTYVNLVALMSDEESKDVLLAIAEEEVKHKHRFEIEYEQLLKKS